MNCFYRCLVGFVALFVLGAHAQQSVLIDSLSGQAEVKRAGAFNWQSVDKGVRLFNNDLLRVHAKSGAKLAWPLKNLIVVKENSQVRINLFEDKTSKNISQHITVFFGALYFVVEKTLPKAFTGQENLKVYTPTSIISIRGTSFMVAVAPDSGTTRVAVTNGTVRVQNIIRNESLFLRAGMQTTVRISDDPNVPTALLTDAIDSIKTWVEPALVDTELAKGGRLKPGQMPKGTVKYTAIAIIPFENSSGYAGDWNVTVDLARMIAAQTKAVKPVLQIDTAGSVGDEPIATGRSRGCGFVVTGQLTEFEISKHAKVDPGAQKYVEYARARIRLRLLVTDVKESRTVYDNVLSYEFDDVAIEANSWPAVSRMQFSTSDKEFSATALGKSVLGLVTGAADAIVRYTANR